jgi:hypothetical protein
MLASLLVITAATSASSCEYVRGYTKANGTYVSSYTRNCGSTGGYPPVDNRKLRELADKTAKEGNERLLNSIPKQFDYEGYVKNNSSIQFR